MCHPVHRSTSQTRVAQLILPELPQLPEGITVESPHSPKPPPPIDKDSIRSRSQSSTRHKPLPPPKERRRSRGSTLQLVATNPDLLVPPANGAPVRRPTRKRQNQLLSQWSSLKHWFKESAKRAKSPTTSKSDSSTIRNSPQEKRTPTESRRSPNHATPIRHAQPAVTPTRQLSGASYNRPQVPTSGKRSSLSPAPLTPRSSYRHSSGASGLRGRKSTSSSVSSVRSIHYLPSHSKASSTSSTTNSIHSNIPFSKTSRSPHTSVKVLPSTPTITTFPSNVRLVRAAPNINNYNESASFGSPTGLVFAKRKKTPFRGPGLTIGTNIGSGHSGSPAPRPRDSSSGPTGGSRSASVAGRASGEIIEEEDEEDIEEVENFSPVAPEAEETIWEGVNDEPEGWTTQRRD